MNEMTNGTGRDSGAAQYSSTLDYHDTGRPTPPVSAGDRHDRRRDAVLAAVEGYAVVVETGDDRYRRRLYLTLKSAERAVTAARARGRYAEIVLVRLVPVGVTTA